MGASFAQRPYFQQDLRYEIHVSLDDSNHVLTGRETLHYQNNSPDTLKEFFFHVWPNAYSSDKSAFAVQQFENGSLRFKQGRPETKGGITSSEFKQESVHGLMPAPWNGNPDILHMKLAHPILPGKSTRFDITFSVKIPDSYSRLGHVGQQYQICQWYPKPAVYDREGWHPMPYLDQGEFYSEFGEFDVHITVPKNYVVGATGDLPPGDPELSWIRKREALSLELLNKPVSEAVFPKEFAPGEKKTLHFHQEKVHDFAWFCDQNYYVLADTVKLPQTGREVRCVAMFTNLDRDLWRKAPEYVGKALWHYSNWNGDYPYNHATAVDGALSAGAGMEYPNITVLGAGGSASNLEMVTMHEVGHNWYYGILGSNEREYPWMDEGLNTYFEGKYWKVEHGDTMDMLPKAITNQLGIDFTHTFMGQVAYGLVAGQGADQAIQTHAGHFTSGNYGIIAYMKSGLAFNYLEAYLGEELTDRCFHAYYEAWKFKHPGPDDIQAVFEQVSGKDLGWFFDGYLTGVHKIDFRLSRLKDGRVRVTNSAKIKLPAPVSILDKSGNVLQTIWTEPFLGETELTLPEGEFHSLRLDAEETVPELYAENNSLRAQGPFKHCKPLALNFLYKYPDPSKSNLNLMPALGFNTTDGFMGGILLHSGFFPKRRFEFHVMPMFGFRSDRITGSAGFTSRWTPSSKFSKIEYHLRFSTFAELLRIKNYLQFDIRPKELRSKWRHQVVLASHILAYRPLEAPLTPTDWYLPVFGSGTYNVSSNGTLGDFNASLELGGNTAQNMARLMGEAEYTRKIGKKAQFFVRGFGGHIFASEAQPYLFEMRVSGARDPFGEAILIDRAQTTALGQRQVTRDHGSFSSVVGGGSFDANLFAINTHFKLPLPWFSVFADLGAGNTKGLEMNTFYDAGIRFNVLREALHINFPVVGTLYGGLPASGAHFLEGINFSVDLKRLSGNLLSALPGL
jgi:hypothetical protein